VTTLSQKYTILHTESSLGWGGQEHRVLLEARVLRDRGHKLLVAADPRGELSGRAKEAGFPVFPVQFGGMHNIRAWLALRRLIREEGVDILNTHSSLDSWVGFLAWRSMRGRPRLVRTRHLSTQVTPNWPTRRLYRAPAAVITTSRDISALLHRRLGVPLERLYDIPTGVSLTDFAPRAPASELLERLNIPPGAFVFGTVSVLRSWKGHLYVLEAMRLLLDQGFEVYFLIVGEGPYRVVIQEKIEALDLAGQVRLVGHQEGVADWFALMDAFVLASYAHEGVPQALLQALAMQRPVAAADTGGIPEVIIPGETGLLAPPRNAPALAQAMKRLMEDATLGESLGREGRKLVRGRFSLEQMADAVEAVYGAIMGKNLDLVLK